MAPPVLLHRLLESFTSSANHVPEPFLALLDKPKHRVDLTLVSERPVPEPLVARGLRYELALRLGKAQQRVEEWACRMLRRVEQLVDLARKRSLVKRRIGLGAT